MHPEIARALTTERMRDLQRQAAARGLARLARRAAATVADCHRAQRRAAILRASTDRYLPCPGEPPADYREFLARTGGPLVREPAAAARSRGHSVR